MTRRFAVDLGWPGILARLGIAPADLLKAARLPAGLFSDARASLAPEDFFRLWEALAERMETDAPGLALGTSIGFEHLNPPLLAAFCSADLATASARLAEYKPLIGPMRLKATATSDTLCIAYVPDRGIVMPAELSAAELVFLVHVARMGTRSDIQPVDLEMEEPPASPAYRAFLGREIRKGHRNAVTFTAEDAHRPFLSANPALFAAFEPELRMQIADLTAEASVRERLRATLMEALPAARTEISDVARSLGMSPRTLQRRLADEGTTYQAELIALRTRLAHDYLRETDRSGPEISYLLGFSDPNSFIRAFRGWTGSTPEAVRGALRFN